MVLAVFLNGVKCRLKDINNLLVDTGMGPDSYAIIALGMVDELLLDKDNPRLSYLNRQQVSKYKTRKKETFEAQITNADLERINDLVLKLKELGSERQAKRAKTYYALKDEYKRLSLELSYYKIAECKASYKELNEQIKSESKRIGTETRWPEN